MTGLPKKESKPKGTEEVAPKPKQSNNIRILQTCNTWMLDNCRA